MPLIVWIHICRGGFRNGGPHMQQVNYQTSDSCRSTRELRGRIQNEKKHIDPKLKKENKLIGWRQIQIGLYKMFVTISECQNNANLAKRELNFDNVTWILEQPRISADTLCSRCQLWYDQFMVVILRWSTQQGYANRRTAWGRQWFQR